MTTPTLPSKSDINGNPTAGTYKIAIGQFYDYVAGIVASMISYTPSGRLVSTDVQSAIEELDTKKISTAGDLMTGALHQANPISLTSASGILTLTEDSNSFIVNGTESITSITGWASGLFLIRWNTARTLTYNAVSLILQGAVNRMTTIGDIGLYEITASGVREVNYFSATAMPNNPAGTIIESACAAAPTGYIPCNGSAISRTTYSALFAAIGTTFGAGDGSTTFNLPDRRDKFGLGKGLTYTVLGAVGGEAAHLLTITEMPNHVHNVPVSGAVNWGTVAIRGGTDGGTPGPNTYATGGSGAHNNMPPYITLNYYIKY